jgi:hypothetical protein
VKVQEALSSKPCSAKRQSRHQAADLSPGRTSASSHLHPHMLAGEPDFSSWPRSNILVSDSSDGGSAARAAPRQTLNKPQAQLLGQAS